MHVGCPMLEDMHLFGSDVMTSFVFFVIFIPDLKSVSLAIPLS